MNVYVSVVADGCKETVRKLMWWHRWTTGQRSLWERVRQNGQGQYEVVGLGMGVLASLT